MIEVNNVAIGVVAYNDIHYVHKRVELDIVIGNEENCGKGYGTDALKTLVRYLLDKFDLNRIWIVARANNPRAIRAYAKAGFIQEGVHREEDYFNGEFVDCVYYSLIRRQL